MQSLSKLLTNYLIIKCTWKSVLHSHWCGFLLDLLPFELYYSFDSLQDITFEIILGGKNSAQDPLLLKLLFVGQKTMSQSIH